MFVDDSIAVESRRKSLFVYDMPTVIGYPADMVIMIEVRHRNGELSTNYWSSVVAATGLMYLSWSGGYADLLVPKSLQRTIFLYDWINTDEVVISYGRLGKVYAFEIMLITSSSVEYPHFTLFEGQSSYMPDQLDQGKWVFNVWCQSGKRFSLTARFRIVDVIPHLQPWCEH